MSSGLLNRAARGRDPDGSAQPGRWREEENSAACDPASDTVTGLLFMQVELPSRRWYIEAVGDAPAAE
ncbi:MAG: hypothetical protein WBF17_25215 [Phycisphaerae bacterium]